MTITQETDRPDISFHPTAPPLPTTTTAPIDVYASVATVTAIPIVSATSVPDSSTILESSPTPSSSCPDGTDIERTTNSDGSFSVKVTRITAQYGGYHDVRIEHYMIPASVANSVMQSMDITGMAPSSLYMTKIEDHRLPPGVNVVEALSSLRSQPYSSPTILQGGGGGGTDATTPTGMAYHERNRRKRVLCFFIVMIPVVVWAILKVSSIFSKESSAVYTPPSPSDSYDDNFFNPFSPTPSSSNPMSLDDDGISAITMAPTVRYSQTSTDLPYPS